MRKTQPYDNFGALPFGVGDVCRVIYALNEHERGNTVAGYIVGWDIDRSHIYISINPEHVGEACTGGITDERRQELGIEKIALQQIRVITPLRDYDEPDFIPRAWFIKCKEHLERSACPSPAPRNC